MKISKPTIYLLLVLLAISCEKETEYKDHEVTSEIYNGKQIEVSEAFIDLTANNVSITHYNATNGEVTLSNAGSINFVQGNIITIDVDTMGYLRKVISAQTTGGQVEIKTEQAFLNEVFVDEDFMLRTELIEPIQSKGSLLSNSQISSALTDKEGYIHPVEIIYHSVNGTNYKKDVLSDFKSTDGEFNIISVDNDFTGTNLLGTSADKVHLYIAEGNMTFFSDAVFEFDYDFDGVIDENTRFKKGSLKMFKYYFESEASFLAKLKLKMIEGDTKEATKRLLDLKKITAKFMVGTIPVWISFDCDIYGKYTFECDASLDLEWGFESTHNLVIGGMYTKSTDSFTPIKEYTPVNTVYPFNLSGELNLASRVELYPRIEVKFYDFFGPYAEVVPYVRGYFNSSLQYVNDNGSNETFVAWDLGIDLGMDFRVGSELTFLWGLVNKEFGPDTYNCFETPLWKSPQTITLLSNLPAEADPNTTHKVKVKVTDNMNMPVAFCPVYFEGDGNFSQSIAITNINGEAEIDWTLGVSVSDNIIDVILYDSKKNEMSKLSESIYSNGNFETNELIIQPNASEGKDAAITFYYYEGNIDDPGYLGNGNDTDIKVRYGDDSWQYTTNGLIQFPLNNVPSNVTIAKGVLRLYSSGYIVDLPTQVSVAKLKTAWNESSVIWNTTRISETIGNITVTSGGYQWHEIDITETIKDWLNGVPNYGLELSIADFQDAGFHFYTSDHEEADKRPIMEITYY